MDQEVQDKIMLRWKLVYDEFDRHGPWDGRADEYTDKACSYTRYGLRRATIEIAADFQDQPLEVYAVPANEYVQFRWIAINPFVSNQSKVIGLSLISHNYKVELYKTGFTRHFVRKDEKWFEKILA